MKKLITAGIILLLFSCHVPAKSWIDNLAQTESLHTPVFTMVLLKMKPSPDDSATLTYKVRLFPSRQWEENQPADANTRFNYGMDSCFSLQSGRSEVKPAILIPVNNGIAHCYEYLLSFTVSKPMQTGHARLFYRDVITGSKRYTIEL